MNNHKQNLFYSLPNAERLGHLATELFYLQNLYPIEKYNYNIFVPELNGLSKINKFVFKKVTKNMNVIETNDENILWEAYRSGPDVTTEMRGEDLYVLLDGSQIYNLFLEHAKNKGINFYYSLSEEEKIEGLKLRRDFGIPENAPVITLHVRDRGFLPNLNYHSFRDANIENYLQAVEYLLGLGAYVVRIGDPSMKKIEGLPPNFIDAIHHPAYTNMVEPYFIATSLFHLGTISGPVSVALAFKKPVLYTNTQLSIAEWGHKEDLSVPKKFYSYKLHRFLSYQEILNSPLVEYCETKHFDEADISLVENSPREILLAVNEMILRISGQYQENEETKKINTIIKNIQKDTHLKRNFQNANPPFYAAYYGEMEISHSFCALNPWFLGHNFIYK